MRGIIIAQGLPGFKRAEARSCQANSRTSAYTCSSQYGISISRYSVVA